MSAAFECFNEFYPGMPVMSDTGSLEVSIIYTVSTHAERAAMSANADLCGKLNVLGLKARAEGVIVNAVVLQSRETLRREMIRQDRSISLISV